MQIKFEFKRFEIAKKINKYYRLQKTILFMFLFFGKREVGQKQGEFVENIGKANPYDQF